MSRHTTTHTTMGAGVCCVRHCIMDANTIIVCLFVTCVVHTHLRWGVLLVGQLVPVTSTPYGASRSGLSTPSSMGNLNRNLISKQASRLDAFSGYPFRT